MNFYKDLKNLTDIELIYHYFNMGIKEKRICQIKMFYEIFPNFNLNDFKKIYKSYLENLNDYEILKLYFENFTTMFPNLKEFKKKKVELKINFEENIF